MRKLNSRAQQTIARAVEVRGVGYLTGADITLRFVPAPADTGVIFVRTDLKPAVPIPARAAIDPLNAIPVEALPARKSPTPPRAVVAPRPLPIRAIVAALAVAAVGALPSILAGTARLPEMVTIVVRAVSITTRAAMEIALGSAAGSFGVAPLLSWLSAGLFVMVGLGVARAMSRRRALQGGM